MIGIEGATLADLSLGLRIAAVGDLNEEGLLVAKRIHVIPGKATGIFEKQPFTAPEATGTATPSATPTATGSATTPIPTEITPTVATSSPTPSL